MTLPLKRFATPKIDNHYSSSADIVLFAGEASAFLSKIPDGEVKLVVTSPPYNLGKAYETRQSIEDYLKQQEPIVRELVRVLADDGSLCWEVGNYVQRGEVFPLDIYYYDLFKNLGLKLRNRLIWHFEHGLHATMRFSGRYETILWFTKGDKYCFNLDAVRVPAKYPGKTHYKGPNRGKPSGNPLGKNPGDKWAIVQHDWEQELWDIPNVKANHPEKTVHPCQFPIELVERCVLALSNEGDRVLDPFAGVGSTLLAALRHSRKALGSERDAKYWALAADRIRGLYDGTLKIRPLGKPVHQPKGNEKVSRIPPEWEERE
jgi:adenine-specific DNA-methyltransferase